MRGHIINCWKLIRFFPGRNTFYRRIKVFAAPLFIGLTAAVRTEALFRCTITVTIQAGIMLPFSMKAFRWNLPI